MADLMDGESVEMKGSSSTPYVIRNMGGVYSCTCPAWRNQSVPIEKRTCKHIRKLRGDEAENNRLGAILPQKPVVTTGADADDSSEPRLLLAESWDNHEDLSGWWMSEKLDGVRAYWDGQQFLSRQGNLYHAPDWFIDDLPNEPLDGELWIDRKAFQRTVSIVRRQDKSEHWKAVRFLVFDAPSHGGSFEARMGYLKDGVPSWKNSFLLLHHQELCRDMNHLRTELQRIESLGGEGLMLREPGSAYVPGRSSTLLKVKTFHDAEATVVAHEPGRGKHTGRLGALVVQLPNGKQFSVGTGFSDRQRESPPPVGSLIQFRYQELSDGGIPRFPSYVGLRTDLDPSKGSISQAGRATAAGSRQDAIAFGSKSSSVSRKKDTRKTNPADPNDDSSPPSSFRRFELVEESSSKFWEVSLNGDHVTTRWGRIGSDGQTKTKIFGSPAKAHAEHDRLIAEKLSKGYQDVRAQ